MKLEDLPDGVSAEETSVPAGADRGGIEVVIVTRPTASEICQSDGGTYN